MSVYQLEIVTPQRSVFDAPVDGISVPTVNGTIGVLPRHMSLFTSLTEGEIKIITGSKETYISIGGGFMEVTKKRVSILVSQAFHAHELNEADIKKAQTAAKDAIARKVKGGELSDAQALLRRSFVDLKVLRRMKHRETPQIPS